MEGEARVAFLERAGAGALLKRVGTSEEVAAGILPFGASPVVAKALIVGLALIFWTQAAVNWRSHFRGPQRGSDEKTPSGD